jgi:phage head maturation protease
MELKNYEIKESLIDMDARTFEGYASTWDVDQTGDIIHSGAFAKSNPRRIPCKAY